MRWRLERAAGIPAVCRLAHEPRVLLPVEVLADLIGSGDFPAEVIDPDHAASIIVQRLIDAGLAIVDWRSNECA